MLLYINACVREGSRTDKIARALIDRIGAPYEELDISDENMRPLDKEFLNIRTALIESGNYDDPMFDYAKKFAKADIIVISAPFWDLSFPSVLKIYLENIYAIGIVSEYGSDGMPHGLCKAQKLFYVTTAGGQYTPDYSYNYIKELAEVHFGIPHTELIKAEMLDVDGFDAEVIVNDTIDRINLTDY